MAVNHCSSHFGELAQITIRQKSRCVVSTHFEPKVAPPLSPGLVGIYSADSVKSVVFLQIEMTTGSWSSTPSAEHVEDWF